MERRRGRRRSSKSKKFFKKIKPVWIIKGILYILGIYCFFYSQKQYNVTLVNDATILTVGIAGGIVASLIIERDYKYYLFSIILLGSLCTAALFRLNRGFAHSEEVQLKKRILYKALASPKVEHSRVTVDYEGYNKDIAIARDQESLVGPASFVILTVHKGGLGYYIITDSELAKEE